MQQRAYFYTGIIALVFLWTGSAFISVAYRMLAFYDPPHLDLFMSVYGYGAQALGMMVVALGLHRYPQRWLKKRLFTAIMLTEVVVITAALLSNNTTGVSVLSLIMNLLHGGVGL